MRLLCRLDLVLDVGKKGFEVTVPSSPPSLTCKNKNIVRSAFYASVGRTFTDSGSIHVLTREQKPSSQLEKFPCVRNPTQISIFRVPIRPRRSTPQECAPTGRINTRRRDWTAYIFHPLIQLKCIFNCVGDLSQLCNLPK